MILLIVYLALGAIVSAIYPPARMRYLRRRRLGLPPTYTGKMKELTSRLVEASRAVDEVLTEMADAHRTQEVILRQQSERMETLSATEKEIQERVESLKEVPLPAAEYFAELSRKAQEEQEKRSASRDYKLIIISALLSAAITAGIIAFFG